MLSLNIVIQRREKIVKNENFTGQAEEIQPQKIKENVKRSRKPLFLSDERIKQPDTFTEAFKTSEIAKRRVISFVK